MGHRYLAGTQLSTLSERKILGGNLQALPPDLLPADVAYAALGHLHKPQSVDGLDRVRYARSFPGDPPAELMAAFHEILEQVQGEEKP